MKFQLTFHFHAETAEEAERMRKDAYAILAWREDFKGSSLCSGHVETSEDTQLKLVKPRGLSPGPKAEADGPPTL